MDRIALGVIVAGLSLIVTLVAAILGQPAATAIPGYAAIAASFAGLSIIGGLVVLERRTQGPFGPRVR